LTLGVLLAGSAVTASAASAAAPSYDVPTGAQSFVAVTAANEPNPTELESVLDMTGTTADAGVPRCLGGASFAHTAWAWVAPDERPRLVRVSATPNATREGGASTSTPDLAFFVQPLGGTQQGAQVSEPQLCDGREVLGDDARGDANPDVTAILPAGHPALVQVGWRDGEPQPTLVANLNATRIDALPAPAGDEPGDAPAFAGPGELDVPLAGATLGEGDPAEPFCQARATVWRRVDLPAAGDYTITADGRATTLTAFAAPVSGDSAIGCGDVGDGAGLALPVRLSAAGSLWLRVGVDDPTGSASTRLRVQTGVAAGVVPISVPIAGPPGTPPGRVAAASDALLQCTTRRIVLTNALTRGKRQVRVTGVAGTTAAGRRVAVRITGHAKASKTVKVAKDGTFTATFTPGKAGRASGARYVATMGSARSIALALHPRFAVTSARRSGTTRVVVKGRLSKPLGKSRTVRAQIGTCSQGKARWRTAKTVRRSRTGAVSATVARPRGASVVVVRLVGSVRATGKRGRTLTATTANQAVGF
jgi:hypothetical protein